MSAPNTSAPNLSCPNTFAPNVEDQIIQLIAASKSLDPATLTPATSFDELGIDSLDKINLSFEVEELFNIQIPDASLNSLRTIGDVINGVRILQNQHS